MPKYFKITGLLIFSIFVLHSLSFCEESFTITTYYPSPYGVYKELRLYPNDAASTCDSNNKGAMYYSDSGSQIYVCNGSSWETATGKPGANTMVIYGYYDNGFNVPGCPSGWSNSGPQVTSYGGGGSRAISSNVTYPAARSCSRTDGSYLTVTIYGYYDNGFNVPACPSGWNDSGAQVTSYGGGGSRAISSNVTYPAARTCWIAAP